MRHHRTRRTNAIVCYFNMAVPTAAALHGAGTGDWGRLCVEERQTAAGGYALLSPSPLFIGNELGEGGGGGERECMHMHAEVQRTQPQPHLSIAPRQFSQPSLKGEEGEGGGEKCWIEERRWKEGRGSPNTASDTLSTLEPTVTAGAHIKGADKAEGGGRGWKEERAGGREAVG